MAKPSKRMRMIGENTKKGHVYPILEAITLLKSLSKVKFKESIDVSIALGIDPRKSDQSVRGAIVLPQGIGRSLRVAVLTQDSNQAEAAHAAGAHRVKFEDLITDIKAAHFDFDVLIATPEVMPTVIQLGPILGPRKLMPNPKLGTVTTEVVTAVRNAMAGQIQYRADKGGIVHAILGKVDFQPIQLQENLEALLVALKKAKPPTSKGTYFKKLGISSTMGPGLMVDTASLNVIL
jgi:large subunit ribosomal protein L1